MIIYFYVSKLSRDSLSYISIQYEFFYISIHYEFSISLDKHSLDNIYCRISIDIDKRKMENLAQIFSLISTFFLYLITLINSNFIMSPKTVLGPTVISISVFHLSISTNPPIFIYYFINKLIQAHIVLSPLL